MNFIISNLATIVVGLLLVAIVAGIIIQMRNDRRKGKSLCVSKCSSCPMGSSCHKR
ncbi:attachment p12 family protein [Herbinix hemicellulosilytica]|uniref:Putative membrane protein n=1 Tax=Herbinix hemicellulosilytica TaxID=1564487 RepID=A0A0H5SKS2_HERHM|nr:FeoB-associated Cys-rich membrane protein [Herbinix hemicellulosilytica]RBP57374.1 attachment p12 family protein [Herbinix hemicellulosilytica]CRZ35715.1 putative membrane protein [Herbinix hemicellulosilytica]